MMQCRFRFCSMKKVYSSRLMPPPAIVEVERQKATRVVELSRLDGGRAFGVEILRGLALDEDRVSPHLQDGGHREHVCFDDVLESRDEGLVTCELLVPPAEGGRECRADEHLVHGRVELHPGKALREGAGIPGEELGEVWVLEVADPIGHAEVA